MGSKNRRIPGQKELLSNVVDDVSSGALIKLLIPDQFLVFPAFLPLHHLEILLP